MIKHIYLKILFIILIINQYSLAKVPVSSINLHSKDEKTIINMEHILSAHSQCLIDLQQQLLDNQADINLLRGQIQENQHQLTQVVNKQKKIYQYITNMLDHQNPSLSSAQHSTLINNKVHTKDKTLTNDSIIINSSVENDYNKALSLILTNQQYDKAILAFQDFIKKYPKSTYLPNVHYWLGQSNYNLGKEDNASYHFAMLIKKYPKSSKSPDALLKIGIIMQNKGQKDKAKAIYQQVIKLYPNSDSAQQGKQRLMQL